MNPCSLSDSPSFFFPLPVLLLLRREQSLFPYCFFLRPLVDVGSAPRDSSYNHIDVVLDLCIILKQANAIQVADNYVVGTGFVSGGSALCEASNSHFGLDLVIILEQADAIQVPETCVSSWNRSRRHHRRYGLCTPRRVLQSTNISFLTHAEPASNYRFQRICAHTPQVYAERRSDTRQ